MYMVSNLFTIIQRKLINLKIRENANCAADTNTSHTNSSEQLGLYLFFLQSLKFQFVNNKKCFFRLTVWAKKELKIWKCCVRRVKITKKKWIKGTEMYSTWRQARCTNHEYNKMCKHTISIINKSFKWEKIWDSQQCACCSTLFIKHWDLCKLIQVFDNVYKHAT